MLQGGTSPDAILVRHTIRAQAVNARVTKMITSQQSQLDVIEGLLLLAPTDLNLLNSQMEVDKKLELAMFELTDVVEVKTTADESMTFNNAWWTYCERTDFLVRSRGKVYSLVLSQCTTVLLDKMKQVADWQAVSDSYNPLKLLKLIEKFILKQSDNQYKIGIAIKQVKLLLAYWQDDCTMTGSRQGWMLHSILVYPLITLSSGIGKLKSFTALTMSCYWLQ